MTTPPCCDQIHRRTFLADFGMGFAGLALGAMLHRDGIARAADPDGSPHHRPRAKNVIWIFLSGGYSHLETFDPKPALTKYAGKTLAETPFPDPRKAPEFLKRSRSVVGMDRDVMMQIYPLQIGYKKHGQSGIE